MIKILLVEDEQRIARILKKGLEEYGYLITLAHDGEAGKELINTNLYDLVVTDIVLPQMNGFDLCKHIKSKYPLMPIIILTALDDIDHKLQGFDSGADDYMVKPFDLRELDARMRVLLKRERNPYIIKSIKELSYSDVQMDLQTRTVLRDGKEVKLTPKEFNLLKFMLENPERVITRNEIAQKIWNTHFDTGTNFIDVYINYLRNKMDRNKDTKLIHTKPGVGFIFKSEDKTKNY